MKTQTKKATKKVAKKITKKVAKKTAKKVATKKAATPRGERVYSYVNVQTKKWLNDQAKQNKSSVASIINNLITTQITNVKA